MDGIRVGLIGFGSVASTLHVPLLRATAGYRVAAVTTSRPAEVAAALPDVELFDDPAAMARQPHLDLVVIATPNDTHAPLAEMVLRAGRHVVVDKPFALTAAEARRLGDVARTTGRVLSVFQNRRWDSDYLTVREAVRRGLVGRVVACESRYDRFRPEVRDRWRERAGSGSGLLYDLGSHLIDQALLLFGVPDTGAGHTREAALRRRDRRLHAGRAPFRRGGGDAVRRRTGGRRRRSAHPLRRSRDPREARPRRAGAAASRGSRAGRAGLGSRSGRRGAVRRQLGRDALGERGAGRLPGVLPGTGRGAARAGRPTRCPRSRGRRSWQ